MKVLSTSCKLCQQVSKRQTRNRSKAALSSHDPGEAHRHLSSPFAWATMEGKVMGKSVDISQALLRSDAVLTQHQTGLCIQCGIAFSAFNLCQLYQASCLVTCVVSNLSCIYQVSNREDSVYRTSKWTLSMPRWLSNCTKSLACAASNCVCTLLFGCSCRAPACTNHMSVTVLGVTCVGLL